MQSKCNAGDLEYCTLLGHRLHIDVAVYFAALRTFARYLKGRAIEISYFAEAL